MDAYERRILVATLQATGWNQRHAARFLGVLPSTLSEKMKKLGLRHSRQEAQGCVAQLVRTTPSGRESGR